MTDNCSCLASNRPRMNETSLGPYTFGLLSFRLHLLGLHLLVPCFSMDQYQQKYHIFRGLFTSINPSYFDVHMTHPHVFQQRCCCKAHRVVLAACSDYMRARFCIGMAPLLHRKEGATGPIGVFFIGFEVGQLGFMVWFLFIYIYIYYKVYIYIIKYIYIYL